jgi:ATP-dependent RNA helicase SUPV3L1/SUV3
MAPVPSGPRVQAVLGPTNTGKTYLAIERMLGHASGMIGFPLRLLARENYDRIVRLKGSHQAALVTGEEKIVPPTARYFCCTVESMPLDRPVEFLAVDEVQLCADRDRGHVFTDRLLRARGIAETMFLGSDTIRPLLRRLVPEAEIVTRPRFSRLTYTGPKKITRLPRRTAVIAFSAGGVYETAEILRRQRGGTAVVMGALSPRTRNAQVALFQSGEVDYLVATDAIGMGLNMDIDHVAFTGLVKFDGEAPRRLKAPELAQIAGRAGRHMNHGTFGTTGDLGALAPELVEAVEEHRFDPLRALRWRSADLDFASPKSLIASLERPPPVAGLLPAREADDHLALIALAADADCAPLAASPEAVRALWDVCQIPDFRKTMADAHLRILKRIYLALRGPEGRIPADWVADQMSRLDRVDGDIDTLTARIAHIRTWTYVSHASAWLEDARHWQERARLIEDRLSDALHDRLTQRFVDRRAAALTRLRDKDRLTAAVAPDGEVVVEGEYVGRLDGFRFTPDTTETGDDRKALLAAANRALRGEIAARVRALASDPDDRFDLADDGRIRWRGAAVARLARGARPIAPAVEVLDSDLLAVADREAVRKRLAAWLAGHVADRLAPLVRLDEAKLSGPARGLAYQLVEALGTLARSRALDQARALGRIERGRLRELGVRLGFATLFLPALLKPAAVRLRALLWTTWQGGAPLAAPGPGLVTVPVSGAVPDRFYEAVGYPVVDGRAVRADILERLGLALHTGVRKGPVPLTPDLMSLAGLGAEETTRLVVGLGYRAVAAEDGIQFVPRRRARPLAVRGNGTANEAAKRRPSRGRKARRSRKADPGSPFAKLRELGIG